MSATTKLQAPTWTQVQEAWCRAKATGHPLTLTIPGSVVETICRLVPGGGLTLGLPSTAQHAGSEAMIILLWPDPAVCKYGIWFGPGDETWVTPGKVMEMFDLDEENPGHWAVCKDIALLIRLLASPPYGSIK